MQKLDGKSMNIIEQNIEKLKEIFPEVFSEGKIDFSKLEEELGNFKEKSDERYNFTWNGKSEAKKIALAPSTGTLRPCKEESKDWDTTQNLYIEGDNLEVLKLLQKSYHKKVKMIYIDPPYNTGKDFVYKDNFRDNIKNYLELTGQVDSDGNKLSTNSETSGRYHSDWLNMMYPRLKLARNLLKDDGVIFISIDDNEVANLRKLCDEIFGEDNFVAQMSIITGANQSGEGVLIQKNIETCLVYSKNIELCEINKVDKTEETLRNLNDAPTPLETRDEMGYTIYYNPISNDLIPLKDYDKSKIHLNNEKLVYSDNIQLLDKGYIPIRPGMRNNKLHRWRWGFETFLERISEIVIQFKNNNYGAYFKQEGFNSPKNIHNFSVGTLEIKNLFDGIKLFDYPKSIKYLSYINSISTRGNELILDFFSGSATTAHAVMKLNSEDDGNRKFICVQLPESTDEKSEAYKAGYKNICEIGKERIRRAGEKVKTESGKDDLDIGFKVLKLDSSNIKSWDSDFENLETNLLDAVENIKSDRNEEDLLYEILLKYGLDLTLPIEEKEVNGKKLYNIGFGALIICLDSNISIDITDEIIAIKKEYDSEITRVVFKDSGFKNATEKTNIIKTLNQNGIDEVVSV
ncbi:site-specific DNA-methyltransferase [Aliarcobacter cryaerophilus]|uniref:site-specific DNA-methyltransferase n=1 Tax=Aliarcobacter cryaerophilus TaxID=28198 RepID=UPI003DA5AF21